MASTTYPPPPDKVAAVFNSYPPPIQKQMRKLRALILNTAAATDRVGPITETLKWGEPAYLTDSSRSGSTIRIAWKPAQPDQYAMYFNCQTTLVDTFRTLFPELNFEGNRALILQQNVPLPATSLAKCIELTLTYHLQKRANVRQATS
jgi:hypothetical protein